jgi:hypothetical protein
MKIPDNLQIAIGLAVAYADRKNKINSFVSAREPFDEAAILVKQVIAASGSSHKNGKMRGKASYFFPR